MTTALRQESGGYATLTSLRKVAPMEVKAQDSELRTYPKTLLLEPSV